MRTLAEVAQDLLNIHGMSPSDTKAQQTIYRSLAELVAVVSEMQVEFERREERLADLEKEATHQAAQRALASLKAFEGRTQSANVRPREDGSFDWDAYTGVRR